MTRKKKNKRSKLVRMTEEERIRCMQHRIELELEAKRRKQQLIAVFTKNKLKREEVFSKLNIAKINEKWRYFLRQIKCKELHVYIEYLSTTFDRTVRSKDSTISYLYNELKVADADHRKLQETHTLLINNIIGKYKQKLIELHDMYKFNDIKMNNMLELIRMKNYIEQYHKEISNYVIKKSINIDQMQSIRKTYNAVNIFNILYLEENMVSHLVHQSFLNIEDLWEQLCKVINEYQRIVENKKKQYEYLKEQDDIYQTCTIKYSKVYLQLQNTIESLKFKIQTLSEKKKEQIEKLKIKDINIKEKYKNIKYEFNMTQMIDTSQLKKLTVTSNEVLKHLKRILEQGSKILEIIKICTSLEPVLFNLKKYFVQDAVHIEFSDTNIPTSCAKIDNFWKYYNYVKANNILLQKEGNKLYKENKKLKYKLQTYLLKNSSMLALRSINSFL
ncbi:dynein regulatory complex subunit 2 [Apis cerana]|uniref:Dynein regulatory complex subunit 2 n=1 Tax=Apis cerana cerana TaxID=94128 RepID=A0A2A3E3N9_APICC|nr:dynein regulatory complex subunit 2 [Apis cerana]PBC26104.1 Coiled-coil domain-containing protein [Apis cerana cerana]